MDVPDVHCSVCFLISPVFFFAHLSDTVSTVTVSIYPSIPLWAINPILTASRQLHLYLNIYIYVYVWVCSQLNIKLSRIPVPNDFYSIPPYPSYKVRIMKFNFPSRAVSRVTFFWSTLEPKNIPEGRCIPPSSVPMTGKRR